MAEGKSPAQIAAALQTSRASVHVHTSNIRRKTGADTSNPRACHATLITDSPNLGIPTTSQMRVLRMTARGCTIAEIVQMTGLTQGTVFNQLTQGCKRLGMVSAKGENRAKEIGEKLWKLAIEHDIF